MAPKDIDKTKYHDGEIKDRLLIVDLPPAYTENDVRRLTESFGTVTECLVRKSQIRPGTSLAFVQYTSMEHAKNARFGLDDKLVENLKILVRYAEPKRSRQAPAPRRRPERYHPYGRSGPHSYDRYEPPMRHPQQHSSVPAMPPMDPNFWRFMQQAFQSSQMFAPAQQHAPPPPPLPYQQPSDMFSWQSSHLAPPPTSGGRYSPRR
jgi:RNA recognition motif-containing protein